MIRYPEKQRYHNYIDPNIMTWLGIHFPEDSSYNGRIFIGHHKANGDGLYNLTRRNIGELKDFVSQMHISRKLDYYITANSMAGVNRSNEDVFALHNIVIDIDCHQECGANLMDKVASLIWRCSRDLWTTGECPAPNSIVMTGRGIQMWWAINPISVKVSFLYYRLQAWIMDQIQKTIEENPGELQGANVDRAASSKISGWFRFPLTYNTKTNTCGILQVLRNERYDMQELFERFVPADYAVGSYKSRKNSSESLYGSEEYIPLKSGDIDALKGCTTALASRVLKLARLRVLRNSPVGDEKRDLYCFVVYCSLLGCFDHEEALSRTFAFNKGFKQPMNESELGQALSSATEKGYRISNEWIIEALEISEAEQEAINLYVVSERSEGKRKGNRARDGVRKALKEDRDNKIIAMHETGICKAQIARTLGVSRNTVISVIKTFDAEIEAARAISEEAESKDEIRVAAGAETLKIESKKEKGVLKNGAYIYVSYLATSTGVVDTSGESASGEGVSMAIQSNNRNGPDPQLYLKKRRRE